MLLVLLFKLSRHFQEAILGIVYLVLQQFHLRLEFSRDFLLLYQEFIRFVHFFLRINESRLVVQPRCVPAHSPQFLDLFFSGLDDFPLVRTLGFRFQDLLFFLRNLLPQRRANLLQFVVSLGGFMQLLVSFANVLFGFP